MGWDSLIQIWDVPSRKPTVQLKGHINGGIHFTFNHEGNLLASTGWDHTLRLWDPRTGELAFQSPMIMLRLLFSADDRLLAACLSETTRQASLVGIMSARWSSHARSRLRAGKGRMLRRFNRSR